MLSVAGQKKITGCLTYIFIDMKIEVHPNIRAAKPLTPWENDCIMR